MRLKINRCQLNNDRDTGKPQRTRPARVRLPHETRAAADLERRASDQRAGPLPAPQAAAGGLRRRREFPADGRPRRKVLPPDGHEAGDGLLRRLPGGPRLQLQVPRPARPAAQERSSAEAPARDDQVLRRTQNPPRLPLPPLAGRRPPRAPRVRRRREHRGPAQARPGLAEHRDAQSVPHWRRGAGHGRRNAQLVPQAQGPLADWQPRGRGREGVPDDPLRGRAAPEHPDLQLEVHQALQRVGREARHLRPQLRAHRRDRNRGHARVRHFGQELLRAQRRPLGLRPHAAGAHAQSTRDFLQLLRRSQPLHRDDPRHAQPRAHRAGLLHARPLLGHQRPHQETQPHHPLHQRLRPRLRQAETAGRRGRLHRGQHLEDHAELQAGRRREHRHRACLLRARRSRLCADPLGVAELHLLPLHLLQRQRHHWRRQNLQRTLPSRSCSSPSSRSNKASSLPATTSSGAARTKRSPSSASGTKTTSKTTSTSSRPSSKPSQAAPSSPTRSWPRCCRRTRPKRRLPRSGKALQSRSSRTQTC